MNPFYKQVALSIAYFLAVFLACRFLHGIALLLIAVVGALCGIYGRRGCMMVAFLTLPFLSSLNPILLPRYSDFAICARLGMVILSVAIIGIGFSSRSSLSLPLKGLLPYLLFAFFSSLQGWFPLISIFKILNFGLFILAIQGASRIISKDGQVAFYTRCAILALAVLYVYGSLLTLPFPAIAYLTSLSSTVAEEGIAAAEKSFHASEGGMFLFCGITSQSQLLGPLLASLSAWFLCDALLIERRIPLFHWIILLPIPFLLFMTRSRLALLVFVFAVILVIFFCLPRIRMDRASQRKLLRMGMALFLLFLTLGIVAEAKDRTITRWLRKTESVQEDSRSIGEALTASRMGTIDRFMDEFCRNPLLGSGFQVAREHPELYRMGAISLFSAPVEKGLLPMMVLGETGVIGSILFLFSLFYFFYFGHRRRLYATMTLFGVYLMTNMAEATFFSPGGAGGLEWFLLVLGGFSVDCNVLLTCSALPRMTQGATIPRRRMAQRKHRMTKQVGTMEDGWNKSVSTGERHCKDIV